MFEIEFVSTISTDKMHNYMTLFNLDEGPFLYHVKTWGGSENDHFLLLYVLKMSFLRGGHKIQKTLT